MSVSLTAYRSKVLRIADDLIIIIELCKLKYSSTSEIKRYFIIISPPPPSSLSVVVTHT